MKSQEEFTLSYNLIISINEQKMKRRLKKYKDGDTSLVISDNIISTNHLLIFYKF
jgi:hypothetical protein